MGDNWPQLQPGEWSLIRANAFVVISSGYAPLIYPQHSALQECPGWVSKSNGCLFSLKATMHMYDPRSFF